MYAQRVVRAVTALILQVAAVEGGLSSLAGRASVLALRRTLVGSEVVSVRMCRHRGHSPDLHLHWEVKAGDLPLVQVCGCAPRRLLNASQRWSGVTGSGGSVVADACPAGYGGLFCVICSVRAGGGPEIRTQQGACVVRSLGCTRP